MLPHPASVSARRAAGGATLHGLNQPPLRPIISRPPPPVRAPRLIPCPLPALFVSPQAAQTMALALMAMLLLSASGARAAAGRKMLEEDAWAPAPSEGTYGYDADMVSQDGGMDMKMADEMDMDVGAVMGAMVDAMVDAALAPGEPPPPLQLQLRCQRSPVSPTTSETSADCNGQLPLACQASSLLCPRYRLDPAVA